MSDSISKNKELENEMTLDMSYFWYSDCVAMDMASHMSSSYLDIRICFFHKGEIHNFYLLAIPMYTHHTTEQTF